MPLIDDLALAPDSTLWVERRGVGEESRPIDVFEPGGRYLGTLPAEFPFPTAFLPDERVLVITRDEFDVQRIAVMRLEKSDRLALPADAIIDPDPDLVRNFRAWELGVKEGRAKREGTL